MWTAVPIDLYCYADFDYTVIAVCCNVLYKTHLVACMKCKGTMRKWRFSTNILLYLRNGGHIQRGNLFQGRSRLTVCLCSVVYLRYTVMYIWHLVVLCLCLGHEHLVYCQQLCPGLVCLCTKLLPCQYNMGCQNLRSTIAVRYLLTTPSISIHS